jgi:hypothetical protein
MCLCGRRKLKGRCRGKTVVEIVDHAFVLTANKTSPQLLLPQPNTLSRPFHLHLSYNSFSSLGVKQFPNPDATCIIGCCFLTFVRSALPN